MKQVSELEGAELDYWVAQITGMLRCVPGTREFQLGGYSPSTKWEHGGPLIDEFGVGISAPLDDPLGGTRQAFIMREGFQPCITGYGPTVLIAAMRALVASKYGETVPEEPENAHS